MRFSLGSLLRKQHAACDGIWAWVVVVLALFTSGCATFAGRQLPKQASMPPLTGKACYVSEQVTFDALTAIAGTPTEYVAPYLRAVIGPQAQALAPALQEKIDARLRLIDGRVATERFATRSEEDRKALAFREFYELGKTMHITIKPGRYGYIRGNPGETGVTVIATSSEIETVYTNQVHAERKRAIDDEISVFRKRMRLDAAYRDSLLESGLVWFDCRSSLVEGNASTWLLEGLLCSLTLTALPAHHNKTLDVSVTVYEKGKVWKREYRDNWNAVFWLPLFPIGVVQGEWPDQDVIRSVVNNVALTAMHDWQNREGK
jgi:hypothetical protein